MNIRRADIELAKRLFNERLGNGYVYGGMWSPSNPRQGTDCSGLWNDVLGATVGRLQWGREAEGATTESYRYIKVGEVGPFGTIRVASPRDIPANAVAKLAFHHEGNGGAASHMWGELDGVRMESAGSKGQVTGDRAMAIDNPYANAWAYLPGPIDEDGTPHPGAEPKDTLFADVSEWQAPVSDAYTDAGYRVITIRANDGTHRDLDWASNYAWCKRAVDDGRLAFFIVYFVWRPNVTDTVATLKSLVGEPHPRMAVMIDVESWGGQITGDQSAGINAAFDSIASWLGDRRRVIGYGNRGDLDRLWPNKPAGVRLIVASYGSLPSYPGMIAHQYTNGEGYGARDGLPDGAPPFGKCDMNAANDLTPTAFAAALGIDTQEDDSLSALTAAEQREMLDAVRETRYLAKILADVRFTSRSALRHLGEQPTETAAGFGLNVDGNLHVVLVTELARLGDPVSLAVLHEVAGAKGDPRWPDRQGDADLALRILASLDAGTDPHTLPPAEPPAEVKVTCEIGGGACCLTAGDGDGHCALGGDTCVLKKGATL
ncbi:lysin A [Mycobacterium Phage Nergal]|nr:lysin A [Mycobacterium Phage Nergal]